jgi:hypothetical protein
MIKSFISLGVFVTSCLFPIFASADMNGMWYGSGVLTDAKGASMQCERGYVIIENNSQEHEVFFQFMMNCRASSGDLGWNLGSDATFQVENGKLKLDGKEVGEISDGGLSFVVGTTHFKFVVGQNDSAEVIYSFSSDGGPGQSPYKFAGKFGKNQTLF